MEDSQVSNMTKITKGAMLPKGWLSLTKTCRKCKMYIPRYSHKVCPHCGAKLELAGISAQ